LKQGPRACIHIFFFSCILFWDLSLYNFFTKLAAFLSYKRKIKKWPTLDILKFLKKILLEFWNFVLYLVAFQSSCVQDILLFVPNLYIQRICATMLNKLTIFSCTIELKECWVFSPKRMKQWIWIQISKSFVFVCLILQPYMNIRKNEKIDEKFQSFIQCFWFQIIQ